MSFGPLSPFDLPMVLEEIGTFLSPSDLCACALVSRYWHAYFEPFLYWLALEDCDAIAKHLYTINIARPLKLGKWADIETKEGFDPNYRLQVDYAAHIDALLERIKRSSSIHRETRRVLTRVPYRSFILLGVLCNNIRSIDFSIWCGRSVGYPGPEVDPQVYTMSTQYMQTQERPDRVIEVIERSALLERLILREYYKDDDTTTLFVNSPSLKSLHLTQISLRNTSNESENPQCLNPHPDAHPALEELLIFRPSRYPTDMLMDLARLQPNLRTFQFTCESRVEPPFFVAPGFHALTRLGVHIESACSIAPILKSASRLEYLWIEGRLPFDEALGLTFKVSSCTVRSPVLNCDPAGFDEPWACNEMEKLIILPDCEPKDSSMAGQSSYTALQAQYAFYLQLSRLKSLKTLDFGGGVGSRSFHAERYLELLCGLDQLEVLNWHSRGLDWSSQATVEHAVLVANHWPHLKTIHGLYHYACRPFIEMSLGSLNPFDLPMVLEEIGTLLSPSDLCACALVNRHWHTYFAPFLYWLALEDCDALLQRLYDINIAHPLEIGWYANPENINGKYFKTRNFKKPKNFKEIKNFRTTKIFDPMYRLEVDYLSQIDTLLRRIEHPSVSSAVHRKARRVLSCQSLMSFILLGTLCDNVREIDFSFKAPPTLINPGPGISPEVCAISTKHVLTQERPDRVIEVIERSTRLERLVLKDDCEKYPAIYRWTKSSLPGSRHDVQLLFLSTPRWPNLRLVQLCGCALDDSFLRTLFDNTPVLKCLRMDEITIRNTSNFDTDLGTLDLHPDAHPALEELMMFRPKNYPIKKQMDFARVQPNLKTLSLTYDNEFHLPPFIAPGFHALRKLRVHVIAFACNIAPLVQAANRLEDLWIRGSVLLDKALALAIKKHRQTLTKLVIDIRVGSEPTTQQTPWSLNGPENPLHLILRSCHALKSCAFPRCVLKCDPAEFDQPWVCNEIEELTILPDCEPEIPLRESSYTAFQAQSALFLQLSRLKSLKTLGFSGGVGSRSFNVEDHLSMLCELDELEELQLYSYDFHTNVHLTVEHAILVTNNWPRLKAIRGLMHFVNEDFVEYVRMQRPDLDLTF
ncbi:hypothetical protein KVV02_001617 [Mortierella alpina]|uniref:F-box domain-containing protein n=1 Tax=Mortierella alpina TaxID=64518 RepID=A0A9P8CZA3_MORAP|nr:hypothetical protein KVV02_001617 [Mortierella alpina]